MCITEGKRSNSANMVNMKYQVPRNFGSMCKVNGNRKRLIFGIVLIYTCLLLHHWVAAKDDSNTYITVFHSSRHLRTPDQQKKILIWLPFYGKSPVQGMRESLKQCPVKCDITDDPNAIHDVNAVLFQLYNLWAPDVSLPKVRTPNQAWVIFNMEPPTNMWADLTKFNGLFNWTVWYRRDATITNAYGNRYSLNPTEIQEAKELYVDKDYYSTKTKGVVGRISNCKDYAQRYKIVASLQKYLKQVDIDMFGGCYGSICGKPGEWTNAKCNADLNTYKFFLAFENAHCTDYVTEKYWDALARNQIPIVNWKHVHAGVAIPSSYINIYDFDNVKQAAEYITKVGTNGTLYNSYFSWKMKYRNKRTNVVCSICESLHSGDVSLQVYNDFDGWVKNDSCPKQTVSYMLRYVITLKLRCVFYQNYVLLYMYRRTYCEIVN